MCLPFHIFYNCVTSRLPFCAAAHTLPSWFSATNVRTRQIKGAVFQVKVRAITYQKMSGIFIILSPKNGTSKVMK